MNDLFANLTSLHRSLDYHLERQSLLASNVANVETPGYRPLDLSFNSYLSRAGELKATDPAHQGVSGEARFKMAIFEDPAAAPGNDGNMVSMEREMAKISANSIRYRSVAEIFNRRLAMLRYAVTDGTRK